MASAVPAGATAALNDTNDSEDEHVKDLDHNVLTRRRIYLERLMGDGFAMPRAQTARAQPWHYTFLFVGYLLIAIATIVSRGQVANLAIVNQAVTDALLKPYVMDPEPQTINDIISFSDVPLWLDRVVLGQILTKDGGFSLATFNRLVPHQGVCLDSGSIMLTLRRVKPTTEYARTTTDRFDQLYPKAWDVVSIEPMSYRSDSEEQASLTGSYAYQDDKASIYLQTACRINPCQTNYSGIDQEKMGFVSANEIDMVVDPAYLPEGHIIYTTWKYTAECDSPEEGFEIAEGPNLTSPSECANGGGYWGRGGYVALITLGAALTNTSFEDRLANSWSVNPEVFVHLLDNSAEPFVYEEIGACAPGLRTTNVLGYDAFWESGFVNYNASSLVLEWTMYNANFQTLTYITVSFVSDPAGVMLEKKGQQRVTVSTIYLDTDASIPRYLMFIYTSLTVVYLCLLLHETKRQNARKPWSPLVDKWFWINMVSIFSSLASIMFWYAYEPPLRDFIKTDGFRISNVIRAKITMFTQYSQASSVATLTICIRLVQCLSQTKARVMLLEKTLTRAMKNMVAYVGYVMVILAGFWAFAFIHLSAYSIEFAEVFTSVMACFGMFLGDNSVIVPIKGAALKSPFYILFMLFFFFISVQMFNAIINYSYNLVCEEMEPQIERERAENKRKAQRRSLQPSLFKRFFQRATQLVKLDKDAAKAETANEKDPTQALSPQEQFRLDQEKNMKAPEGAVSGLMFILFAFSYFWFLYVNLDIESNSAVKAAIRENFYDTAAHIPDTIEDAKFGSISNLFFAQEWFYTVFPLIIFGEANGGNTSASIFGGDPTCISSFNCIVSNTQGPGVSESIVRVRRTSSYQIANVGSFWGNPDPLYHFTGGDDAEGNSVATVLTPIRRDMAQADEVVPSVNSSLSSFCTTVDRSVECTLSSDQTTFESQLGLLRDVTFMDETLQRLTVDLVAYNANRDIIVYVEIGLELIASGTVLPSLTISSYDLFNLNPPKPAMIFSRLVPGFLYILLVGYFILQLVNSFRIERIKKSNENKKIITSLTEFFFGDVFNMLELISIGISISSSIVFVVWLFSEGQFKEKAEYGVDRSNAFVDFLNYIADLALNQQHYNRLSAFNMLIIAVRPLKFARRNARFAQLFKTFADAQEDIAYFILMLVITMFGFVLFAFVSFGTRVPKLGTIEGAFNYCFYYVLGNFNFWPLWAADEVMALVFFPVYLLLFYCVFTNIFFAIVDRFFNAAEPPPFNFKRQFKGTFGRCITCINWDEDYLMEEQADGGKKKGPMSRRDRVKQIFVDMQRIRQTAHEHVATDSQKNSLMLNEVCEVDERMTDVLQWSKGEAKALVAQFQGFYTEKLETRNTTTFVKERMEGVTWERKKAWAEMRDAERYKRYTIQVKERMQRRDQETLARYIDVLQNKIKEKMGEKKALHTDVNHLKVETNAMRYPREQINKTGPADAPADASAQDQQGQPVSNDATNGEQAALPAPHDAAEDSDSGSDSSGGSFTGNGHGNGHNRPADDQRQQVKNAAHTDLVKNLRAFQQGR